MSAYRSLERTPESLGPIVQAHRRRPRVGPAPLVFSSVAAVFAWLGALSHPVLLGAAWVLTFGALVAAFFFAADLRRLRQNASVVVHEKGLHLRRAGAGETVMLWDEVTSVELKRVTRSNRRASAFSPFPGLLVFGDLTEEHWVLRVRAGAEIVTEISDDYEASTALGAAIRAAIAEREIPKLLEAESGTFGPFRVGKTHLEVGADAIPWTDVASVELERAAVVVVDNQGARRARVSVEKVPNLHVLLEVCERMIERRGLHLG